MIKNILCCALFVEFSILLCSCSSPNRARLEEENQLNFTQQSNEQGDAIVPNLDIDAKATMQLQFNKANIYTLNDAVTQYGLTVEDIITYKSKQLPPEVTKKILFILMGRLLLMTKALF